MKDCGIGPGLARKLREALAKARLSEGRAVNEVGRLRVENAALRADLEAVKRRVIVDFGDGRFTVLRPAVAHYQAATYEEAEAVFRRVYGLDEKEVVA